MFWEFYCQLPSVGWLNIDYLPGLGDLFPVAYGEKSNKNEDIPSCFEKLLSLKAEAINKDDPSDASFVFITDTHTPFNRMLSPRLIGYLLSHTQMDIVVWGGVQLVHGEIKRQ